MPSPINVQRPHESVSSGETTSTQRERGWPHQKTCLDRDQQLGDHGSSLNAGASYGGVAGRARDRNVRRLRCDSERNTSEDTPFDCLRNQPTRVRAGLLLAIAGSLALTQLMSSFPISPPLRLVAHAEIGYIPAVDQTQPRRREDTEEAKLIFVFVCARLHGSGSISNSRTQLRTFDSTDHRRDASS